jgi:hypothetical protein
MADLYRRKGTSDFYTLGENLSRLNGESFVTLVGLATEQAVLVTAKELQAEFDPFEGFAAESFGADVTVDDTGSPAINFEGMLKLEDIPDFIDWLSEVSDTADDGPP